MSLQMPTLGLGTYGWGARVGERRNDSDREKIVYALRVALKLGYRLIDTAEVYGMGLSEECIGEVTRNMKREDIFIVSKVWKDNLTERGIQRAITGSLERLGTHYIDLYLVHWPSDIIALSETMPAMEALVDAGFVRAIGVSNFSVAQIQEATRYLKNTTISVNQIEYNLLNQSAALDVIPYCHEQGIVVMAYRPLAKGKLTVTQDTIVSKLAAKYEKTPVQVALNWLISQNIIAIPKSSSAEHLQENWGAQGWRLEACDMAALKREV